MLTLLCGYPYILATSNSKKKKKTLFLLTLTANLIKIHFYNSA